MFSSKAFSISLLFSPENQNVAEGDVFTVKILVSDHSIQGDMFALDFRLIYDPSFLKLVDKNGVETLTLQNSIPWKGGFVPFVDASKGIIEYSGLNITSLFPCTSQGIQSSFPVTVAEIYFKTLKTGVTSLRFDTTMNPIDIINSPTLVYLYSLEPQCAGATIPSTKAAKIMIGDFYPPVISNVRVSKVSRDSFVIKWETNEPSTGQVEYGITTVYGGLSARNPNFEEAHSITMESLLPETLYHFRVKSSDAAGNESISTDNVFTSTVSLFSTRPTIQQNPARNGTAVFHYFTSPSVSRVVFEIFTLNGKHVETFDGNLSGETKWIWQNNTASGIYFYRISAYTGDGSKESYSGKLVILK